MIAVLTGVRWYLTVVLISFHMPVGHLYVFLGKMSVQLLCPFFLKFLAALGSMQSFCPQLRNNPTPHVMEVQSPNHWAPGRSHPLPSFQSSCLTIVQSYAFFVMNINPLVDMQFTNIFSHSASCLFILLVVSFAVWKLFSLTPCHLFIFCFYFPCLGRHI